MHTITVTIQIKFPEDQDSEPFIPQLQQYCIELEKEFPNCSAEIKSIDES